MSRERLHVSAKAPALVVAGLMLVFGLSAARPLFAATPRVRAQDDKKSTDVNAGITISSQATAKEVGLPIYPGAKPHKDADDDSAAASLGVWGGAFGVKLVVLKLDSADSADKVAAFYRKALAKYGPVLDCSAAPAGKSQENEKSNKLTCGDDKPDAGGQMFKSGNSEKQHIVGIKTVGTAVNIQLVYLEARSPDHDAK